MGWSNWFYYWSIISRRNWWIRSRLCFGFRSRCKTRFNYGFNTWWWRWFYGCGGRIRRCRFFWSCWCRRNCRRNWCWSSSWWCSWRNCCWWWSWRKWCWWCRGNCRRNWWWSWRRLCCCSWWNIRSTFSGNWNLRRLIWCRWGAARSLNILNC